MREDLREDLIVELTNIYGNASDISDWKMQIAIILSNYEITRRNTEIVVYEEDATQQMIAKFLAVKLAAGRTERTVKYYKNELVFIFDKLAKPYDQVCTDDIRIYLAMRVQKDGISKTTANNERRALSSFYTWLQKEEILLKNPMSKVDAIKEKKKKKKAFSAYELELIRDACRNKREKAIVEILLSTWCRVSEVAQIRLDEIEDDEIIVHGKGEKDRQVFINAKAQFAIKNYTDERSDRNEYLFPRAKHAGNFKVATAKNAEWYKSPELVDDSRHTDAGTIESIVRNIGKRAGVANVHPHRFRRTGATQALRGGMDLTLVSKLLGHESIDTTQIYLDISTDELLSAHKKYVL